MTEYKNNGYNFLNPGVWFGSLNASSNFGSFPVFCSVSNCEDPNYCNLNNVADNAMVLPGYKIILYNEANYTCSSSFPYIIDNTNGTEIKYCLMPNYAFVNGAENQTVTLRSGVSSWRLFFEGKEIPEQITYGTTI
jgi:hypothetical protein